MLNLDSLFQGRSPKNRLLLLIFLLLAPVWQAQAAPRSDAFQALKDGVHKFELSNGMRVVIYQRSNSPVFTGEIWVKVGGVDEQTGSTGIAHLLEHMAFKGTTTIGTKDYSIEKPLLDELDVLMKKDAAGTTRKEDSERISIVQEKLNDVWEDNEFARIYTQYGGIGLNAGTSKDYTVYMVSLPNTALELWCSMESDRLLSPVFRQFYKEREVVQEERRGRVENDPGGQLYQTMLATAFISHPNRLPVIGWASDLKKLTADQMKEFYKTYYRPDNMVLSLVGDIDPVSTKALLEKYFGRIPKGKGEIPKVVNVEEPQKGERFAIVRYPAQAQLAVAYHKPAFPDPDDSYFAILHTLLSDGRTSIFYRELVEGKQLAASVASSEAPGTRFPSIFYVRGIPSNGVSNEKLRDAVQEILTRIGRDGVSEEQLESAKKRVFVGLLKDLRSNYGLAQLLGETEVIWGDWRRVFEAYDKIMETTNEDIKSLSKKYFGIDNRTTVFLEPTK